MPAALPVAAAAPLADLLAGPPEPAAVAVVGRSAAYLLPRSSPGRVVAVVTPGAVRPPCALVLPGGHDPRSVVGGAAEVIVGDGAVVTATHRLVVRRWWEPPPLPRGRPDADSVTHARRLVAARDVPPAPGSARAAALAAAPRAARALCAGDAASAVAALVAVLGLGPGSTPTGDDVAAGVLVAATAWGLPVAGGVAADVAAAAAVRTTAVSAALLSEAAAGRAIPQVVEALSALSTGRRVAEATGRLLAVGSTSGADLATALLAVAGAALSVPSRHPVRRSA